MSRKLNSYPCSYTVCRLFDVPWKDGENAVQYFCSSRIARNSFNTCIVCAPKPFLPLHFFFQDPEVVMAPLPVSHRPLSMDSRDTSMSNSSRGGGGGGTSGGGGGGGGGAGSSAESGSGFSLPLRSSQRTSSTPDSPSTLNGTLGASSDYLVPSAKGPPLPPPLSSQQKALRQHLNLGPSPATQVETSFSHTPPLPAQVEPDHKDGGSQRPQRPRQLKPQLASASSVGKPQPPVANLSYGLTHSSLLRGSKSTQPLLATENVADEECPLGPLPPTPTDQQVATPSPSGNQMASLDASSLRLTANSPPSSGRSRQIGSIVTSPFVTTSDQGAEGSDPTNEISVWFQLGAKLVFFYKT